MTRYTPSVSIPLPEGWQANDSVTLVAPDGQANVIVSSQQIPDEMSTEEFASAMNEALDSPDFATVKVISFGPSDMLSGRDAWLRHFEWEPEDSPPVSQMQLYHAEAGRGYTATATVPTTEAERYELTLGQLLSGLTLASAAEQPA